MFNSHINEEAVIEAYIFQIFETDLDMKQNL